MFFSLLLFVLISYPFITEIIISSSRLTFHAELCFNDKSLFTCSVQLILDIYVQQTLYISRISVNSFEVFTPENAVFLSVSVEGVHNLDKNM